MVKWPRKNPNLKGKPILERILFSAIKWKYNKNIDKIISTKILNKLTEFRNFTIKIYANSLPRKSCQAVCMNCLNFHAHCCTVQTSLISIPIVRTVRNFMPQKTQKSCPEKLSPKMCPEFSSGNVLYENVIFVVVRSWETFPLLFSLFLQFFLLLCSLTLLKNRMRL